MRLRNPGSSWRANPHSIVCRNIDSLIMMNAMADANSFGAVVTTEIVEPLKTLCDFFAEEGSHNEFAFFANVLFMLREPGNEVAVLEAVIELSKCAFVGLSFSPVAQAQIDSILERAITLSHTMSAPRDMPSGNLN